MEFSFNLNNLLGSEISKIDRTCTPSMSCPGSSRESKKQLSAVIDCMGIASAKAQSLRGAITSASKLAFSDHLLYIMKDSTANSGNGAAVGILKIGTKRLFIYDTNGIQHEREPLCVLDFYVHESRQRMGCGRKLFDFMLHDQNIKAAHMAVDKPSHKFSQFLQKHYQLKATIPQVNNFVVFVGFFQEQSPGSKSAGVGGVRNGLHHYNNQQQQVHTWNASTNSQSRMEKENYFPNWIKQFGWSKEALKDVTLPGGRVTPSIDDKPTSANRSESRGLIGQNSSYSRHTPTLVQPLPLPDVNDRVPTPPPLHRGGEVSKDYLSFLNSHQDVYDRRGHLKLGPNSTNHHHHHHVQSNNQSIYKQQDNHNVMHDHSINDRHSAPVTKTAHPLNKTQHHLNSMNGRGDAASNISDKAPVVKSSNSSNKDRIALLYGPHTLGSANNAGRLGHSETHANSSDVLLPRHFTPYSKLALPPSDPYSSRVSAKRLNESNWNVFGVCSEPKTFSASDRFRNTRPW